MKKLLTVWVLLSLSVTNYAQDPHFTQYFSTGVYLNPAFAGFEGCSRVSSSYRNQWPSLSGTFQTFNISYDQFLKPISGGFSARYLYEEAGSGSLITQEASAAYAPSIRLFDKSLLISPALELEWRERSVTWEKLTFGNMVGTGNVFITDLEESTSTVNQINLNAGILFSHGAFVCGAAFHHLNQSNEGSTSTSKLAPKYTFHFSYVAELTENLSASPSLVYMQQQDVSILLPSLVFSFQGVRAGVASRWGDSAILLLGYASKRFSVGYSFDYTVSKLSNATGGSHELNIIAKFNFKNQEDNKKGIEQVNF
jgi:type IX secretion system PorP/SprF family membrane protein